eukprot:CAMPEP_0180541908 /NCGR_PEP_ID=MMETSP1036_2-20121128/68185_1 /TAXON_ID=632150 /ORGANISM="Azadinium spinosum, Strain 3D9" /LENGTH=291 /DNA_ID=CAMNT_0022556771 /DNA_START=71 /DNA_END=947 /DNA_ORIENTATION=+
MATITSVRQSRLRPYSAESGTGLRVEGHGGKKSLCQRFSCIEENMYRNLEQIKEHRLATEQIKQKRKEDAERAIEEIKKMSSGDVSSGRGGLNLSADEESIPLELGHGNMKDRCSALEENAQDNHATLKDHREFLDEVLAMRGEENAAAAAAKGQSPRSGEQPIDRARMIEENARWMGPAMQAAARSKALAGQQQDALSTSRTQRPTSAPGAAQLRRALGLGMPSRSVASSRPRSAGSMKARCQALEDNLRRNKVTMEENRQGIALVVKLRQEKAEKMAAELMRELREAMG